MENKDEQTRPQEKIKIPEVVFRELPLEEDAKIIALEIDWAQDLIPEFVGIPAILDKDERIQAIKDAILKVQTRIPTEIESGKEMIKQNWEKVKEAYLTKLSEIMNESYPDREITAYISINPISMRFLNGWSFTISPLKQRTQNSNMMIAHEIQHFMHFKKLSEILPEISKGEYDYPHKPWILSEIIATIFLRDPRIKGIIGGEPDFYSDHKLLKIGDKLLVGIIQDLYNTFVLEQNNYADFVREGMRVVEKLQE